MKFAVMFGNRGFFPGELIASARRDFASVLKKNGHESLMMDESLSRYGAVETPEEAAEPFSASIGRSGMI